MPRTCYIVTSYWAHGELSIAMDFAQRAGERGHDPIFLAPPSHEKRLKAAGLDTVTLVPGSRKLNRMLFADVERRHRPRDVVLADFVNYAFCEQHYGLTIGDLDIFSGRVCAFDLYDWGAARHPADTYGFGARNLRDLDVDRCAVRLQPCPILSPVATGAGARYSLFGSIPPRSLEARAAARRRLGLSMSEPVVLVTAAKWQSTHRPYAGIQSFIAACEAAVDRVLLALGDCVSVAWVGARPGHRSPLPRLAHFEELSAADFADVAEASDVYLADNHISTSMARLVLAGMPTVLLGNTISKRGGSWRWPARPGRALPESLDGCENAYPFRMFPVGWHRFLAHVVKDNPYYRLMRHAEIFDEEDAIDKLLELLDGSGRDTMERRRQAYTQALQQLPHPGEVLAG